MSKVMDGRVSATFCHDDLQEWAEVPETKISRR